MIVTGSMIITTVSHPKPSYLERPQGKGSKITEERKIET